MPELPEVETIRRDLEREVVGRVVAVVDVGETRVVRRQPPAELAARLTGATLGPAERRGKHLLLGAGEHVLVVHLGMSGQLLLADGPDDRPKHTHVALRFGDGGELRYVDPRTFGELIATPAATVDVDVPALGGLGIDPLDASLTWTAFAQLVVGRRARLKALLMDQRVVAGIGNIYSDEILWTAGLRHDRASDTLTSQDVRRLWRAIGEVLGDAVRHRGSSLADEQYVDLHGRIGGYQLEHRVHARAGSPCPRCRTPIVRERVGGRSTYSCPRCQV